MDQIIEIISFTLAILGFGVSIIALYYTHLIGPKINVTLGPFIKIYHSAFEIGCGTGIYLPISFFNKSPKSAVIEQAAIEIYNKNNDQKRFFIQWDYFAEFDADDGFWDYNEVAHSIPILGKESVLKMAHFYWFADNQEKLIFQEGVYVVDLVYWMSGRKVPIRIHNELVINARETKIMQNNITNQQNIVIDLLLNKKLDMNKLLSPHESKKLIG